MADCTYHILRSFEELRRAFQGTSDKKPWLLCPKLHYYRHPSWAANKADYTYLMCTVSTFSEEHDQTMQRVVGLIELERSPYKGQEHIVWLKYVTVDPQYQGQGIATRLIQMLARHMAKTGDTLQRSYSTEEGMRIQAKVDQALDEAGVPWTQSHRAEVGKANRTRQAVAA